jgi:Xaa-Pro aminopeptidase
LRDLFGFLKGADAPKSRMLRGFSPELDALRGEDSLEADKAFGAACSEIRLLKDVAELVELQSVIDSTKRGFEDVILKLKSARTERDVEVSFYSRARTEGNDVGYGTIAAAGAHACILHWTRNDAPLKAGELLLLDAGVEGHNLYTADITRTLPISGKFSEEQRQIYELVWKAQAAAMAAVKPGIDFMAPNKVAMEVLAKGLEALGILPVSAEEALKDDKQLYRRYSLHNISHMLGIDVHDCAKARQEVYRFGQLKVGMVFTVEPGLYFQLDDLTVPEKYRGIGVRIEDDIVVTETGYHNLSGHIPSRWDEVEAWIQEVWNR